MSATSRWLHVTRHTKARHTRPERVIRSVLQAMGYRFRVQGEGLPGTPDIVFPPRHKAIFVHGCFWHGHDCRPSERQPQRNVAYWSDKIASNAARHERQVRELEAAGWGVLTLWECEIHDVFSLALRLRRFLGETVQDRRPDTGRSVPPSRQT